MRSKIKINDIFAYIIGNYRYWCYENFRFLLRKHIIEQFEWRLSVMNNECYSSGSCIKCGCDTPALQMANKACEGGCYFKMMRSNTWKGIKVAFETRERIKRVPLSSLLSENPLTPEEAFKKEKDKEYVWPIMEADTYEKEERNFPGKDSMNSFKIVLSKDWIGKDDKN